MESEEFECIIIGAGAAGLMCAAEVGKRGKSVALLEHNETAGKKILISGGGRCNFTNLYTSPKDYVGSERHFHKYALAEYTPKDFVSLVESYKISYFEKESGQLFCAGSAKEILNMLLSECRSGEVALRYKEKEIEVVRDGDFFLVNSQKNRYRSRNLVVATGGLALTSIGASPFGHQIGQKFGHSLVTTQPGLVPFLGTDYSKLSGVSIEAEISCGGKKIRHYILFTHKGLSGPAILKISLYWAQGKLLTIDWLPGKKIAPHLKYSDRTLKSILTNFFPSRFAELIAGKVGVDWSLKLGEISNKNKEKLIEFIHRDKFNPLGTEGYRKAEVTLGGVSTSEIDPQTMQSQLQEGLFFIGEVVDVTGQLGGYNFQWAWASAYLCARSLK